MDWTPLVGLLTLILGGGFIAGLFGVLFMACSPRNIPYTPWQADLPEDEQQSWEAKPYDPCDDHYFEEEPK